MKPLGFVLFAALLATSHPSSAQPLPEYRVHKPGLTVSSPAQPPAVEEPPQAPSLVVSAGALNFGAVTLGQSSSLALLVTNAGSQSVVFTAPPVVAGDPAFSATTTCASTLAAGASCGISVSFTPTAAGLASGALQILPLSGGGFAATAPLSGQGLLPPAPSLSAQSWSVFASGAQRGYTLNGTNFAAGSTVVLSLNGADTVLTPSSNTNSRLDLTLPAGLAQGFYDVRVVSSFGVSSNSVNNALRVLGAPSISSLSPATAPVNGSTISVSGANLYDASGAPEVRIGGSTGVLAASATRQSNSSLSFTVPAMPAGAYPVYVRLVDDSGNVAEATSSGLLTLHLNEPSATVYDTGFQLTQNASGTLLLAVRPSDGLACIFGNYLNYRYRCWGLNTADVAGAGESIAVHFQGDNLVYATGSSSKSVKHITAGTSTTVGTYAVYTSAVTSSNIKLAVFNKFDGNTYFLTTNDGLVRARFNGSAYVGATLLNANSRGIGATGGPVSMTHDERNGDIYIGDTLGRIHHLSASGAPQRVLDTGNTGNIRGVAVGPSGAVYFTQDSRHAVFRTTNFSTFEVFAGSSTTSGDVAGVGSAARFNSPTGLEFYGSRLYVSGGSTRKLKYIE